MNLLTEVRRIKEMMGFKTVLNEQWWKSLFGASDEAAEAFGKQAAEESSNLSKAFAEVVGGKGEWSDILKYAGEQTGKVGDETAAIAWIKTQPDLMKKIAMASDEIVNSVIQKRFASSDLSQLFKPNDLATIESVTASRITKNTADIVKKGSQDIINVIKTKPNWADNDDLSKLVQDLEAKVKLADDLMNTSVVKGTTTDVAAKTIPTPTTKPTYEIDETFLDQITKLYDEGNYTKALDVAKAKVTPEGQKFIDDLDKTLTKAEKDEFLGRVGDEVCGLKESIIIKRLLRENRGIQNFCNFWKSGSKKGDSMVGGAMQYWGIILVSILGLAATIYFFQVCFQGRPVDVEIPEWKEEKPEEGGSSEEENNSNEEEESSNSGCKTQKQFQAKIDAGYEGYTISNVTSDCTVDLINFEGNVVGTYTYEQL
jgi:hypothetical protein